MSVDVGGAISQGLDRTASRNGLLFVGITYVLGVLSAVFSTAALSGMEGVQSPAAATVSLPVPMAVSWLVVLVVTIISFAVGIAALRTFVADRTDQLPSDVFSRNIVAATLNIIVGLVVFAIIVGIGFVLLIIPGIFLLVSLYFWAIIVAVEDKNFYGALQQSWSLTKGERISLFILGLIVVVVVAVLNGVFGFVQGLLGGIPGILAAQIGAAIGSVFVAATTARAYLQLGESSGDAPAEAAAD